ncbi:MAG: hypothetical protein LBH59_08285 [Planctomycetaceae bacterium]|jgi:hypothetical protein|nr:hypothetical protein [Planctomycetaceae bacterium]
MQLSLRTLLAFEDNIFDIEQHRQLERTIPSYEPAAQILARIRNVIHNPKINVPGRNEQQEEELDPNIVAEYLDHQMTKEYQEQFENFCLSADRYLAEVASIHQIVSNVLGEPARISRECRFRCYDLFQKFQHLSNRYENENRFITFPQIHSGIPAAQIAPQVIPTYIPQQTTNYYENITTENQQIKKNIIPIPQKIDPDTKNNSEKNTSESSHKSIRDFVSVVAVIVVIVLLFLHYQNDAFNNIKNNFAKITQKNHNNENTEQQNNSQEPKPDTNQIQTEIQETQNEHTTPNTTTHEHEQNIIQTASTTNNKPNDETIIAPNENKNETLIETKITQQPPIINESKPVAAQPLPLPISDANNPNANDIPSDVQIDPFTALPSSPPAPQSDDSTQPTTKETTPLTDSIFNASATLPPVLPASSETAKSITSEIAPTSADTPTNTNSNKTVPNKTSANKILDSLLDDKPTKSTSKTEVKFHEEPEPQPINSSIWKTQTPNSNTTSTPTAIAAIERDPVNYRNNKSLILNAGEMDNFTDTRIIQANHNDGKNANVQVERQDRNSVTRNSEVLGTVIATGDPMVIFTADSSESQWRFKSNQFDIYANQYILTSAPFRADIRLGEDFVIEMIGDSKISVLPSSGKIAAIYVDYGRLVVRASYNKSTTLQQVKLIKVITEHGECVVGFNGTKSVMFVDTFAEVSRSPTQSELNTNAAEMQIGTNPILGLLPDPSESISWLSAKPNVQSVTKSDMSIVLSDGRVERGIIRNHPNWLRRISVPAEGKQIESACMNIFNRKNISIESALQELLQEKSDIIRSFGYRLWGDLGRFDVPLKGRIFETESIQQSLIQYFKEVMKRDGESIQRLTDAIEKERIKNN